MIYKWYFHRYVNQKSFHNMNKNLFWNYTLSSFFLIDKHLFQVWLNIIPQKVFQLRLLCNNMNIYFCIFSLLYCEAEIECQIYYPLFHHYFQDNFSDATIPVIDKYTLKITLKNIFQVRIYSNFQIQYTH